MTARGGHRHPRILAVVVAVVAVVVTLAGIAVKEADAYVPKHGVACHRGYAAKHRVVGRRGHLRRVRVCVKRHSGATPSPSRRTVLHAHLDPSFTRDPADPFRVTYQFSASATSETVTSAAVAATSEPAPLPGGVLALYSDGSLECAVNVGGGLGGEGECPVHYAALGRHRVTTIYSSGEQSATATELEQIEPLPTTTSLTAAFVPSPPHEVSTGVYSVGTLESQTSGTLDGGTAPGPVLVRREGGGEGEWLVSVGGKPYGPMPSQLALHATTHPAPGYTASEASATVPFSPALPGFWEFESPTFEADEWVQAASGQYVKGTDAAIPLTLRTRFIRSGSSSGCRVRLEVDGAPFEADDEGLEAFGSNREEVLPFTGVGAGPVEAGVYVRSTEGQPCTVLGWLFASE